MQSLRTHRAALRLGPQFLRSVLTRRPFILALQSNSLTHRSRFFYNDQEFDNPEEEASLELENKGNKLFEEGDFEMALSLYQEALHKRDSFHEIPENLVRKLAIMHRIGQVHLKMGNKEKALETFRQHTEISLRMYGEVGKESIYTARSLTALGQVHDALGENQKSLECFNKALSIARNARKVMQDPELHAEILFSLSKNSIRDGNVNEGLDRLLEALDILRGCETDEKFPLIFHVLQGVIDIHLRRKELDKGEELMQEKVELSRYFYGDKSEQTARELIELGAVQKEMEMMIYAEEHFEAALYLLKDTVDKKHPLIALCLLKLSDVAGCLEEFGKQQEYLLTLMKLLKSLNTEYDVPEELLAFIVENAKRFRDIGSRATSVEFATKAYEALIRKYSGNEDHERVREVKQMMMTAAPA